MANARDVISIYLSSFWEDNSTVSSSFSHTLIAERVAIEAEAEGGPPGSGRGRCVVESVVDGRFPGFLSAPPHSTPRDFSTA